MSNLNLGTANALQVEQRESVCKRWHFRKVQSRFPLLFHLNCSLLSSKSVIIHMLLVHSRIVNAAAALRILHWLKKNKSSRTYIVL